MLSMGVVVCCCCMLAARSSGSSSSHAVLQQPCTSLAAAPVRVYTCVCVRVGGVGAWPHTPGVCVGGERGGRVEVCVFVRGGKLALLTHLRKCAACTLHAVLFNDTAQLPATLYAQPHDQGLMARGGASPARFDAWNLGQYGTLKPLCGKAAATVLAPACVDSVHVRDRGRSAGAARCVPSQGHACRTRQATLSHGVVERDA